MSWTAHYKSRVNNEIYFDKFMDRYTPFLKLIEVLCKRNKYYSLCEIGCGIGNVTKGLVKLNSDFTSTRTIHLYDMDKEMLFLARQNLKHLDNISFQSYDVIKAFTAFIDESICVTHGVLEHFKDRDIIESVRKMGLGVHYVPLGGPKGYQTPSYGDERLLTKEYWIKLLKLRDWITFNDEKDFIFYIPKNYKR